MIPVTTGFKVKVTGPSPQEDVISFYFETLYVLEILCVGGGYRWQKPNPNRVSTEDNSLFQISGSPGLKLASGLNVLRTQMKSI